MTEARVERRLAAILAADVAGYSRLMGADEVGTLAALKAHRRQIVDPAIAAHKGRIVKTTGDGMLVEFASAVDAVTCAMLVQSNMAKRNETVEPKICFRIGINVGDIIIEGDDIFGDARATHYGFVLQQGLFSNQGFREPDRESLRRDQALAEMNMAQSRQ